MALNTVATRQESETLFSSDDALDAGGVYQSDIREVAGYNAVAFLGISDQPFEIRVEEAGGLNGPFARTDTLASALAGAKHVICKLVLPFGSHIKIQVANLGAPQQALSFHGLGIPES
jgi:hypothetical protein